MEDEADLVIRSLEEANPLRESTLRAAIAALGLAPGTRGLDVGCGIGQPALLLAEATYPDGYITGVDISPRLVAYAQERLKGSPWGDLVAFKEADMNSLPFNDDTFDWAWSVDCVGYPSGDLLQTLKEIVRVVRPGGLVAVLGWTSQQILPGYAMLEARLNASCSAYAPILNGEPPENQFLRSLRRFPEAGIPNPVCRTFVGEVQAPIAPGIRTALKSLFEMLWSDVPIKASEADRLDYERLCRAESEDFILNLPEYYAFFTYTMFSGLVDKRR